MSHDTLLFLALGRGLGLVLAGIAVYLVASYFARYPTSRR